MARGAACPTVIIGMWNGWLIAIPDTGRANAPTPMRGREAPRGVDHEYHERSDGHLNRRTDMADTSVGLPSAAEFVEFASRSQAVNLEVTVGALLGNADAILRHRPGYVLWNIRCGLMIIDRPILDLEREQIREQIREEVREQLQGRTIGR